MRQYFALWVLAMLLLASGCCHVWGRQFTAPAPAPLKGPALGSIGAAPGNATDKPLCLTFATPSCDPHVHSSLQSKAMNN